MELNSLSKILELFLQKNVFTIKLLVLIHLSKMVLLNVKIKHLLEVSHAIMFSMNVPQYLWGKAILTTSYLINRMLTRVLNYITPLDCFKKYFPESRIQSNLPLKIFGITAYVHIPN